jgi:hypothetical protein
MFKTELDQHLQKMPDHKRVVVVDGDEDWEDVIAVEDGGYAILLHINPERVFAGKQEGEEDEESSQPSSSLPTKKKGLAISFGLKLIIAFLIGRLSFEIDAMIATGVATRIIYALVGFATATIIFAIPEE